MIDELGGSEQVVIRYIVNIKVADVNDNAPIFENDYYEFSVRENAPVFSEVFQFRATDNDASTNNLIYNINENIFFTVNSTTGQLILRESLDAEVQPEYEFLVSVSDMRLLITTSVRIYVIDVNEPSSVSLLASNPHDSVPQVIENEVTDEIMSVRIHDSDTEESNRHNNITVVGEGAKFFRARPMVTEITDTYTSMFVITQIQPVDFEQNDTIQIELQTTERGDVVLHQTLLYNLVVINVNDNEPILTTTRFNFTEDEEGGSSDHQIVDLSKYGFDEDGGRVGEYVLVSVRTGEGEWTDLTRYFEGILNETTGILSTEGLDISLDREVLGNTLIFFVNLTDTGDPSSALTGRELYGDTTGRE